MSFCRAFIYVFYRIPIGGLLPGSDAFALSDVLHVADQILLPGEAFLAVRLARVFENKLASLH